MGIQSTGIGSGIDVNSLITKLMQVEAQPLTTLAKKEASYQAKLSAYGSLNGAVSAFQNSLSSLNNATTFQSLTATSSDSTIAGVTTSNIATAGNYNVNITKLAQSQIISSAGQVSTTATIGAAVTSTITFQFGTISGTAVNGVYPPATTFTQDAGQATATITIDSSNNTLQGIRDAINAANKGVSASIVGDGSATPYHLVINSTKTGVNSSLKITASGDATVASLLNYDPAGTQGFTEVTTAQNAALKINGIDIASNSNSISGAIQGVTITANKIGNTNITVASNPSTMQANITAFVKAYNDLSVTIKNLSSYDAKTKKGGLLLGDATIQSIQNQIRGMLSTSVNGLGGGLTNLGQVGITFQKDGTLAVDATKLSSALTANSLEVGGLFAAIGKSSDNLNSVISSTSATKAGSYNINLTQTATQGGLSGNFALPGTTVIAANSTINITLDGVSSAVSLTDGSYTPSQLASMLQSAINGTTAFSSLGSNLKTSIDGSGYLVLTSNKYGVASNVSIADGTNVTASILTGTATIGTAGIDVAGTLNGLTASGSGQILTGTTGSDAEGLKILIGGNAIGARGKIDFSRGYANQLNTLLNGFVGGAGSISSTTDGVNRIIKDIGKQRDILNSRLFDVEARYRAQFTTLDRVVSGLNNTSNFLTQQLAALNGSNNR